MSEISKSSQEVSSYLTFARVFQSYHVYTYLRPNGMIDNTPCELLHPMSLLSLLFMRSVENKLFDTDQSVQKLKDIYSDISAIVKWTEQRLFLENTHTIYLSIFLLLSYFKRQIIPLQPTLRILKLFLGKTSSCNSIYYNNS